VTDLNDFTEVKIKHATQVAEILRETHKSLTAGQITEIQKQAADTISDWQIAPLSRVINEMIVQGLIGTQKGLTRCVPTQSEVQAHLEAAWLKERDATYLPGSAEVEIARTVRAMSDDERLSAVPFDPTANAQAESPISATEMLAAQAAPPKMTARQREIEENTYFLETFGWKPHEIDPRRRAELLVGLYGEASTRQLADARTVDQIQSKPEHLRTTQEIMSLHRAQGALKSA
jgi:hypothetical protein